MYDDGSVYMPLIHLTTHTFLSTLESTMDCWTDGHVCLYFTFHRRRQLFGWEYKRKPKSTPFWSFFHTRWLRMTMTLLLDPARRKWPMVDGDDDGNVAVAIADVPV